MVNKYIYMDNGATTKMKKEVVEAMLPYFDRSFGNASSVYKLARESNKAMEEARENMASLLGVLKEEIYFTSGGTESDNWAIRGAVEESEGKHIITTKIEHHAVLHTTEELEKKGYKVTYLDVDEKGYISLSELKKAITDDTCLISIMAANNEIGTIQNIKEIGKIAKEKGVLFHTDAVQALGKVKLDFTNIDLASFSAHKIHGPKGVGALYIKKGTKIKNLMFGGAQEKRKRPGTENVAGIVGFAKALELALFDLNCNVMKMKRLKELFIERVFDKIDDVTYNGDMKKGLCNNISLSFKYVEGEAILLMLDRLGIAASSGSACTSRSLEPSHVLLALGKSHEDSHGTIRFTISSETTKEEVEEVTNELPAIISRLRDMSPLRKGD